MKDDSAARKLPTDHASSGRTSDLVQPFLKWAGGKRQLLPEIRKFEPQKFKRYFEPFVGAGAVFLDLKPTRAVINDTNADLMNCYRVIKSRPQDLIAKARSHEHTKEAFYRLRQLDRNPEEYAKLDDVARAARVIFLNKTCFNGLFRVNSRGEFNVPFGDIKNPRVVDEASIYALSSYLNDCHVEILEGDFVDAVSTATKGDFVYLDPPYDPLSDTSYFTGYSLNSFGKEDQKRLRDLCVDLSDRGCRVLLSNSATDFIRELYADERFEIVEVQASRNINSVGTSRQKISELLVHNRYACNGSE